MPTIAIIIRRRTTRAMGKLRSWEARRALRRETYQAAMWFALGDRAAAEGLCCGSIR